MKTRITTIALAAGLANAGIGYTVRDLGSLGIDTEAAAVNEAGVAVGRSYETIAAHAAVRFDASGPVEVLGPISFTQSQSVAINPGGAIVAMAFSMGELTTHAYLIEGGVQTSVGAFVPRAIDAGSNLVGARPDLSLQTLVYQEHAAIWDGANRTDLPTYSNARWSIAHDIDADGRIVGSAIPGGMLRPRAILWDGPAAIDLGTLAGPSAQALAMNDLGDVVGVSDTATGAPHAFLFHVEAGVVTERVDLGALSGDASAARDVNAARQVVGVSNGRAFLWQDGAMQDLNDLVADLDAWELQAATAISDAGIIVGHGVHAPHGRRAFMLVPVDECLPDLAEPFGILDLRDITTFVTAFLAGDPIADFAPPDGVFDLADINAFVQSFLAGCP